MLLISFQLNFVHRHLLWSISALEYIEVVAEVGSEYLWRDAGKWFTVLAMRLLKWAEHDYKLSNVLSFVALQKKVSFVLNDGVPLWLQFYSFIKKIE